MSFSFNNLRSRKLRSWLTMIGIFIGIAAVVSLFSLGEGLQNAISSEFEELGTDKIFILPGSGFSAASFGGAATGGVSLVEEDLKVFQFSKEIKVFENQLRKAKTLTDKCLAREQLITKAFQFKFQKGTSS